MTLRPLIRLELIAAVAANGVIGRSGQLPWRLPDDLAHFKQLTLGHAIIMGRRTYESIGRPLPGRQNVVISRGWDQRPPSELVLAATLDEAILKASALPTPAFVIGGAVLYAAALSLVEVMHLTELDEPVEGDVLFPQFDRTQWRLTSAVHHPRDERHTVSFTFSRYERA
ncbi:MAG: dihydrofolate reductase [Planctomycetota bacterium]|nr:dihydrofolate reductase [Planctomycetota bacterium]